MGSKEFRSTGGTEARDTDAQCRAAGIDSFGTQFSEFMRNVLRETRPLADATEERLGVPPEKAKGDSLADCVKGFQGALDKAKAGWMALRKAASIPEGASQQVELSDVLACAEERIEPCSSATVWV